MGSSPPDKTNPEGRVRHTLLDRKARQGLAYKEFAEAFQDPSVSEGKRLTEGARQWIRSYFETCGAADERLGSLLKGEWARQWRGARSPSSII